MASCMELDLARQRWREKALALGLPDASDPGRGPKGLGSRVVDLSTRIVAFPSDPHSADLSFDEHFRD